jgi:hypothetical protein
MGVTLAEYNLRQAYLIRSMAADGTFSARVAEKLISAGIDAKGAFATYKAWCKIGRTFGGGDFIRLPEASKSSATMTPAAPIKPSVKHQAASAPPRVAAASVTKPKESQGQAPASKIQRIASAPAGLPNVMTTSTSTTANEARMASWREAQARVRAERAGTGSQLWRSAGKPNATAGKY